MMQETTQGWATFDCYGTLVNWEQGMRQALASVIPGDVSRLLERYYEVEKQVEAEQPFRCYRDVLAETLRRTAGSMGMALAPGDEHVLAKTLPTWPVFSDVDSALRALRAQGWKLAILSNVDRDLISGTLRALPVPFDDVVTAEDVRAYKPALKHFRHFQDKNRVANEDWIHVARSYFHDIVPASQLSIRRVWVNRGGETAPVPLATVVLPDLRDLAPTLQRLRG
ncbi:MAG: haloacid dehalogenase type II [Ktedonobacteraceae bacterium]|nr:haloacid dehalogenase type II [Ktedonobacteraceae bacterium]